MWYCTFQGCQSQAQLFKTSQMCKRKNSKKCRTGLRLAYLLRPFVPYQFWLCFKTNLDTGLEQKKWSRTASIIMENCIMMRNKPSLVPSLSCMSGEPGNEAITATSNPGEKMYTSQYRLDLVHHLDVHYATNDGFCSSSQCSFVFSECHLQCI